MTADRVIAKGLAGIVVDNTATSLVDGEAGRLYYRGYPIEQLVEEPFAAVAHLLVFGELPTAPRLAEFEAFLWQSGRLPADQTTLLDRLAATGAHPMAVLQAAMPLMADGASESGAPDEHLQQGLVIASRLPTALAHLAAGRRGAPAPAYPQTGPPTRSYCARFLELLQGAVPSPASVRAFEQTQILQIDHSFNASTFTARVVTSTLAPVPSALAAAMGSLYGPLHGGADQAALEMAQSIGSAANASRYVSDCLASRRVVMGMGHREYRVVDPRARIVRRLADELATSASDRNLIDTLKAVEEAFVAQTAARPRTLRANLEFYKGVVYRALGIPTEFFTATFATARIFGWCAHIVEQRADNRIVRPSARYIGPAPRQLAIPA
ncbi:MAG TPA: citrate/2-methylcitrate synthase [Steroidobacteraceae bacterium]|nr:citrate/2-methylcitrate synthase [Steroidobacteraceae bacterium]